MQTQSTPPTIADYRLQLDTLRQQENELFQLALTNPQEEILEQIQAIWTQRNKVYQTMDNAITPMPAELIQSVSEPAPVVETPYTLEEFQAIPSVGSWRYTGEVFKRYWVCKCATGRYSTLPQSVINSYGLTPRQVAILEEKIQITRPNVVEPMPDGGYEPCWHDIAAMSRTDKDYASNREIIMGRY
jgi:hypothetical protein